MIEERQNLLVELLDEFANEICIHMTKQGFTKSSKLEDIALMHTELSEMVEGIRHNNPPSEHIPMFTAEEEEGADLLIRLLHYMVKHKIALPIFTKHEYNLTRPYKHGKTI
jgi:hypothetical protein